MKFSHSKVLDTTTTQFAKIQVRLQQKLSICIKALSEKATTAYAFINTPFDTKTLKNVALLIQEKKALNPSALILAGIGGSILSAQALQKTMSEPAIPLYAADTLDATYTQQLYEQVAKELSLGKKPLLVVVSKSGTTTETIINASIFLELFKKNISNYHDFIVVITEFESPLWHAAKQEKYSLLEVPKNVGGRFSAFSAAGLFPLGMLGYDIESLCNGAQQGTIRSMSDALTTENFAALSATILYENYLSGKNIHDTFIFAPQLAGIGAWYRQLMGESLGKTESIGITPTVSLGTQDLHSVAQLYLAGPHDKITTFLHIHTKESFKIPKNTFSNILPFCQDITINTVAEAIFDGTRAAYIQSERPYMLICLPDSSAYTLGEFMQMKMFEILYLAALLEIDPFNQPQVELYKKATHQLLKK